MSSTLLEFAGSLQGRDPRLVGVLLQEVAVMGAKPKLLDDNGRVARFETTLQDTSPNRNRRLYTEDVLASAIASAPVRERLRTRTMYGEANHPFSDDLKRQLVIDQTRVSHLVVGLEPPKGGSVRGVVETAGTRCGRDMRGLIVENGSQVAFSMRGMGGVRKVPGKDLVEVAKPLALVTYDWVTFPSHQTAYMDTLQECHHAVVGMEGALAYARDQSDNFSTLMEQFELQPDGLMLSPDQSAIMVAAGGTVIAAFLEEDIRRAFRDSILRS